MRRIRQKVVDSFDARLRSYSSIVWMQEWESGGGKPIDTGSQDVRKYPFWANALTDSFADDRRTVIWKEMAALFAWMLC
jgi:hypothetical protein